MEPDIRFIEGSFTRVTLGPDDVIVLSCPGRISDSQMKWMSKRLKEVFPGRRGIILEDGIQIGAFGPLVEADAVL